MVTICTTGSTHTYIVMHNQSYKPPIKTLPVEQLDVPNIINEYHETNNDDNTEEVIINNEEIVIPVVEEETNEFIPEHSFVSNHKPPSISTEEDEIDYETSIQCLPKTPIPSTTIRSIKDILNQREERK